MVLPSNGSSFPTKALELATNLQKRPQKCSDHIQSTDNIKEYMCLTPTEHSWEQLGNSILLLSKAEFSYQVIIHSNINLK